MADKLLNHKEAADFLRISIGTLYNWVSTGRIAVVRLGARCNRYREKDLVKFRDSRLTLAHE